MTQNGADAHLLDPLAHLTMSLDGQRSSYDLVHRWAHKYAGGKWLAVGGGGYAWVDVVARAWTHLIAEITGHPIEPATPLPAEYRAFIESELGQVSPELMTDGRTPWARPFDSGYDPDDQVDQAILATRRIIFPGWGLVIEPGEWF